MPNLGIIAGGLEGRGYEWLTEGLRPGGKSSRITWESWLEARLRFHLPEAQSRPVQALEQRRRTRNSERKRVKS